MVSDDRAVQPRARPHAAVLSTFIVALVAASVVALRILAPFFTVLLVSLATFCLIYPRYLCLVRLLRGSRRLASGLVCLLLALAVLVPVLIIAQAVSREAVSFYELTTVQLNKQKVLQVLEQRQAELDRLNRFTARFGITVTPGDVYRSTAAAGVQLGGFFYRQGVALTKGLFRILLGFCFWLLVLYYLMVEGENLKAWFLETLPMAPDQQRLVIHRFADMSSSLLVGNGLAGLIQGFAGGAVFALAGLPGPALWGMVMAILAFIPVIGISLVFVPTTIVLLVAGETGRALAVFFPLVIVAAVVEYWLKPILVGRRAQMHTLLVFLSLLGGMDAFGAVGLVVGPLLMTAFLTLLGIYRDHYRPSLERPLPAPAPEGGCEPLPASEGGTVDEEPADKAPAVSPLSG